MSNNTSADPRLLDLYREYSAGRVSRRGFIRGASAVLAAGASIPAWMLGSPAYAAAAQTGGVGSAPSLAPLDLAEWSYFFVGVERIEMARGSFVNGKQMYVESFIPAQVRHPYPIVLVHGGGGQGLDWMGTPDGRRGWAQILLEDGYKVYVVDRPGHGRSPFHPDVDGPFPAQNLPLEQMSGQFTPPNASRPGTTSSASCTTSGPGPARSGRATSISSWHHRADRTCRPAGSARRLRARPAGAPDAARARPRELADRVQPDRRAAERHPLRPLQPCSALPACPPAAPTASTWCGVSAVRCCSTRSVHRSS